MMENVDHLAIAKKLLGGDIHPVENSALSKAAIAHALIALVERLDKLSSTDYNDETRCLRVDTGIA